MDNNVEIDFTVTNNAVTHLGRNLYKTTPPALAEIVANSYDAYATNVQIQLNQNQIIVADNGIGMNLESIKTKYAPIGRPKDPESPRTGQPKRSPMGKKGIGKLAAFSLGNSYTIYTKSIEMQDWGKVTLDYEEMRICDPYKRPFERIDRLPADILKLTNEFKDFDSGFIVVVNELRRKNVASTKKNLRIQLSRRFYIRSSTDNFDISLDEKPLDLSTNAYYDKLEYLVYVGYSKQEIQNIFGTSLQIAEYCRICG